MNTNLVNSKTLNDIALLLYTQKGNETGIFAWMKEHKIITFIIICIIIFLWYKYRELQKNPNKRSWIDDNINNKELNDNPKQENFMFEFKNTLNDNDEYQLDADNSMNDPYTSPAQLRRTSRREIPLGDFPYTRPTFNPGYSVRSQKSYVRYLPSEYPRQSGNRNILVDNSGKLIKNGGILPDQGISDMKYDFSPIIGQQNKGPDYYDNNLFLPSRDKKPLRLEQTLEDELLL